MIDFIDDVVGERQPADAGIEDMLMGKDQGRPVWGEVLAWCVVTDRVSFPLEIVLLTCSSVFPAMVAPDDGVVPAYFVEIGEVANAVESAWDVMLADEDGSAWQHLRWLREKRRPAMDYRSIHIDQDSLRKTTQQRIAFRAAW